MGDDVVPPVPLVPPPPSPVVPAAPPVADGDADGGRDPDEIARSMLRGTYWGCQRITAIPAGRKNGGRFGAFEARCYFHTLRRHAGQNHTGCAKYCKKAGPTWQDRYEQLQCKS